ncbi:MAG: PIN domain-containing protein [Burkholderiaceae bacterium]|nr:PIN domain-containing protein [Burkholderiaceae bacterium]
MPAAREPRVKYQPRPASLAAQPRRALLDVNVLIALLDAAHVHHAPAMRWLQREISAGWASCPLTQAGCIRVMSQPAYPGALPAAQVAARLAEAAAGPDHMFWPDDLDLLAPGALDWSFVLGHRQVTDSHLLALAVRHGGRLVSFDRRIVPAAVPGATAEHLVLID